MPLTEATFGFQQVWVPESSASKLPFLSEPVACVSAQHPGPRGIQLSWASALLCVVSLAQGWGQEG